MSFEDDETGQDSAEPIELFLFTVGSQTYYYTSGPSDYDFDGNTYVRTVMQRDPIKVIQTREKSEVGIQIPIGVEVVDELIDIPPIGCTVIITRVHPSTGNYQVIFRGQVLKMDIKGRFAKLSCLPVLAMAMDSSYPPKVFSRQCNHHLYDGRCTLTKTDFEYTATVLSVTNNIVVINTDAGDPDSPQNKGPVQRYSGGEMMRIDDDERRRIVRQGDYTTTGAYPGAPSSSTFARTFYLSMPFRTLEPGDTVKIYEGCSKSAFECLNKFDNVENFGGYPLVPIRNIYTATNGVKGVD